MLWLPGVLKQMSLGLGSADVLGVPPSKVHCQLSPAILWSVKSTHSSSQIILSFTAYPAVGGVQLSMLMLKIVVSGQRPVVRYVMI